MKPKTLIYPVFLPMQGCDRRCVYCDQSKISGAAAPDLPTALAGVAAFIQRNPGQAKQIAFYGGSFTALDQAFRERWMEAFHRIADERTGFRCSTHPLHVAEPVLDWCRRQGFATIELGIQDFDTAVLEATGRGYDGSAALKAAEGVKAAGFQLGVQLMPGLPGWSTASLDHNRDILVLLKPDFLRLYPLIVIQGTPLAEQWRQGAYLPLSLEEATSQCADYCELASANGITVIKTGLPSNLDPADVLAGPWHPAFGELVKAELLYRLILARFPAGGELVLTASELALLKAHGALYLKKLDKSCQNHIRVQD